MRNHRQLDWFSEPVDPVKAREMACVVLGVTAALLSLLVLATAL
jgi:hypothetical protein